MIKFLIVLIIICFTNTIYTYELTREAVYKTIKHYVYFNRDRERINEKSFINNKNIIGAQLKYTWRELEPKKNRYRFNKILKDYEFLKKHNKKLFIQLQEASWGLNFYNVPQYIIDDKEYDGGVCLQYSKKGNKIVADGYIPKRWNLNLQKRFAKLLNELGKAIDGKVEGINLSETSIDFVNKKLTPKDYSDEKYFNAIINNMKALKKSFKKTVIMQYANFMPGEWLPWEDKGYLKKVFKFAKDNKIGIGGPDLLPYRKGQMNHLYKFLNELNGEVPTCIAVQWNNYKHKDKKSKKRYSIKQMIKFAKQHLKVDYIFWCTQEPYYSNELLFYLKNK